MADRYWVGGTGTWDNVTTTNWSATSGGAGGASAPTSADNVFFNSASSGAAYTVTVSTSATCADMTMAGPATGNVTWAGTVTLSVYGSMTVAATGVTRTYTGQISFFGSGTHTLTINVALSNTLGFFGSGSYTLGAALTTANAISQTAGTFSTSASNFALAAASISSTGATARTISLNGSTVTLNGGAGISFSGALTFNAGTSTVVLSSNSATVNAVGYTFNILNFTNTTQPTPQMNIASVKDLTLTPPAGNALAVLSLNGNLTVTGTLTLSGASNLRRVALVSGTIGTTRTVTAAAVSLSNCDFRDITGAGAATWSATTSGGDAGGNTGITFTAPKTVYWNLTGTQNWTAGWATTSGGTPSTANMPLAQDTAIFNNAGAATSITWSGGYIVGTVDMSTRSTAFTLIISSSSTVHGNWLNGVNITLSSASTLTFTGRGSQQIAGNGTNFAQSLAIYAAAGGTYTLTTSVATTSSVSHFLGTLDLNGMTLSASSYSTGTGTKTLRFNGGNLTLVGSGTPFSAAGGLTTSAGTGTGTISLTSSTAKTFAGSGVVYNCTLNQGGLGALTISGSNTFNNITNTVQPASVLFSSGTTNTFLNFNLSGTAGNLITVGSTTAATHTLSKASGTVSVNYLSISNSIATGGAGWYANTTSTNGGGNTGWNFTAPPAPGGNTGAFFSIL